MTAVSAESFHQGNDARSEMDYRRDTLTSLGLTLSSSLSGELERAAGNEGAIEGEKWGLRGTAMTGVKITCPALSLHHSKSHREACSINHANREEAANHAAALLARSLTYCGTSDRPDEKPLTGDKSMGLSAVLIENVVGSFAVLVDSRLRAYATFLARHCRSLAKRGLHEELQVSEQKLETLLTIGSHINVDSIEIAFDVEDDAYEEMRETVIVGTAPLEVRISMRLNVLDFAGQEENLPVFFASSGIVQGRFEGDLFKEASLSIDCKQLLQQMMDHAAHLVASVVDTTNNAFVKPSFSESKLARSASFLAMPPPLPKKPYIGAGPVNLGLELLSKTASELPIVSPDLSSLSGGSHPIPYFALEAEEEEEDLSSLSPDQCADIVDGIFGGLDDSFIMGPPLKRAKSSA